MIPIQTSEVTNRPNTETPEQKLTRSRKVIQGILEDCSRQQQKCLDQCNLASSEGKITWEKNINQLEIFKNLIQKFGKNALSPDTPWR